MVRAWFMDDSTEDQRFEHMRYPPDFLDLETVRKITGVLHWKLNPETFETDGVLDKIRMERGYTYHDMIEIAPYTLPEYEERIKIFFTEHLHTDEEIRFIIDGSGYFDVRAINEAWIRIEVTKGDLIILPAGVYHRFTLDRNDYIKVMRLFIGEPVWTPHNRPLGDGLECRQVYIDKLLKGSPEFDW